MSLLDTISSLFGKSTKQDGGQSALIAAVLEHVNSQPGGLNGPIQQFHEKGASAIIESWVSNDENQTISPTTLHDVLGSEAVSNIAAEVGLQPNEASGLLAQILPHIVNTATPQGEVPVNGKLNAESVLGNLTSLPRNKGSDTA
jgi:uncharacterized protein YidB (DUF937 family)